METLSVTVEGFFSCDFLRHFQGFWTPRGWLFEMGEGANGHFSQIIQATGIVEDLDKDCRYKLVKPQLL